MVSFRLSALVSVVCAAVLVNVSSAQTFNQAAACTSCFKAVPSGCQAKISDAGTNPNNTTLAAIALRDCLCIDAFLNNFDCLGCTAGSAVADNTMFINQCKEGNYAVTAKPTSIGAGSASGTSAASSATSSPAATGSVSTQFPASNTSSGAASTGTSGATGAGNSTNTGGASGSGVSNFVPMSLLAGVLIIAVGAAN